MIALADHADGVVLPVRAQPGARRSGVQGEQAGALKVAVAADHPLTNAQTVVHVSSSAQKPAGRL